MARSLQRARCRGEAPLQKKRAQHLAPLHIAAQDNAKDEISDWRIRTTINGESFVFDRWQTVYLKGFKPGENWVKLEFLDNQGNPLKNVFNSTVRVINYQPKGKDTLSRIFRGELTADEVRGIVDQNYTAKIPATEPTPEPTATPKVEKTPEPEIKPEKQAIPENKVTEEPKTQPIEPKLEQPTVVPSPSVSPTSTDTDMDTEMHMDTSTDTHTHVCKHKGSTNNNMNVTIEKEKDY